MRIIKILFLLLLLMVATISNAQKKYKFPERIGPLIKTQWNQGPPYNMLCPKSKKSDNPRQVAGCGPLAMAQVICYHQYPSMSPQGKYQYEWELMFKKVHSGMTIEEVAAVAKLIGDCGVSAYARYGDKATCTNIGFMMGAMKQEFKYSNAMCLYRRNAFATPARDSIYRSLIFSELKAGRPVIYTGWNTNNDSGHLFVIDGCQGKNVHVNFGWGGYRDGYYDLDDLYGYNKNQGMLIEIADSNYVPLTREVFVEKEGTLSQLLNDQELDTLRHIRLKGVLDGDDIRILRDMTKKGMLRTVDMEQVQMENMPDHAFASCYNLSYFVAPRTLKRIGNNSFYGCSNLNNIVLFSGLEIVGACAFLNCTNLLSIHLPSTVNTIGRFAFAGCCTLLGVELPEGLERIDEYAFEGCKNLYVVKIPNSLKSIGVKVFERCPIEYFVIDEEHPYFKVEGTSIIKK